MTNAEARFSKIHIRKVYACLAVTCHLHFWQNDRDFLRATVVTRGWNGPYYSISVGNMCVYILLFVVRYSACSGNRSSHGISKGKALGDRVTKTCIATTGQD